MILKNLIIGWLNSIILMSIKDIKPDLRRFLKLIKYYQINKLKNSMIQQECLEKDGLKWGRKLNKDHTLMKSIKTYFITCHLNKDNNFKDKHKQD